MGLCTVELYAKTTQFGAYSWVDISNYVLSISNFDLLYNNFDFSLKDSTTNISVSEIAATGYYEPFTIDKCIRIKNATDVIFYGFIERSGYDRYNKRQYNISVRSLLEKAKKKLLVTDDGAIAGLTQVNLFPINQAIPVIPEVGIDLKELLDSYIATAISANSPLSIAFKSDIILQSTVSNGDKYYLPKFIIRSALSDTTVNAGGSTATTIMTMWEFLQSCCRMKTTNVSENLSNLYFDGTDYYMQNIDTGSTVSYSNNDIMSYSEDQIYLKRGIDFSCPVNSTPYNYYAGGAPMDSEANYEPFSSERTIEKNLDIGIWQTVVLAKYDTLNMYLRSIINVDEIQNQRFNDSLIIKKYTVPLTLSAITTAASAVNVSAIKAVFKNGYLFAEIETFEEI